MISVNDLIRWSWTILTGLGVLFSLWNLREVILDNRALEQSPQRGIEVLRLQTQSAIWDHGLIMAALLAEFIAGVSSFFQVSMVALVALIASAAILVILSAGQTQRRRRLFEVLRLRRPNNNGGS